ncbi:MAG: ribosomal protein S18-alanine N-acetyltransferase [Chloroflexi bacterium]|nr:ribosomal protein S18-alanine N-acetyltransferase [Chloroflexota bacterium]
MGAIEEAATSVSVMEFAVRPMQPADIPQVERVEREAFPTLWPPTSFAREMKNLIAQYLVAWEWERPEAAPAPQGGVAPIGRPPLWQRWLQRLPGVKPDPEITRVPLAPPQHIVGFVGIWFMTDEAHITALGVLEPYRRRGIGELLLIGATELALKRGSRALTLEVRVSNGPARALYTKYGFKSMGVRRGYYTDNREDALIMTTDPIASPEYRQRFQTLMVAHNRRHGETLRVFP